MLKLCKKETPPSIEKRKKKEKKEKKKKKKEDEKKKSKMSKPRQRKIFEFDSYLSPCHNVLVSFNKFSGN